MATATPKQKQMFGYTLKAAMHEAGISRFDLAEHLNVRTQAVDNYIKGYREPDLRVLAKIEIYVGIEGQLLEALGYPAASILKAATFIAKSQGAKPPRLKVVSDDPAPPPPATAEPATEIDRIAALEQRLAKLERSERQELRAAEAGGDPGPTERGSSTAAKRPRPAGPDGA